MQNPDAPLSLKDWLRTRTPSVPEAFLPYLLEMEGGAGTPEDLSSMGLQALSRALDGAEKNREIAFHLLSADAFLTYACEMVAEVEGDVRAGLEEVLFRVGGVDW